MKTEVHYGHTRAPPPPLLVLGGHHGPGRSGRPRLHQHRQQHCQLRHRGTLTRLTKATQKTVDGTEYSIQDMPRRPQASRVHGIHYGSMNTMQISARITWCAPMSRPPMSSIVGVGTMAPNASLSLIVPRNWTGPGSRSGVSRDPVLQFCSRLLTHTRRCQLLCLDGSWPGRVELMIGKDELGRKWGTGQSKIPRHQGPTSS